MISKQLPDDAQAKKSGVSVPTDNPLSKTWFFLI
jgi:hypothetical protein